MATAGGLWTRRYREKLRDSRLEMTRDLTRLIMRLPHKPSVLVSGSATVYGVNADAQTGEAIPIVKDGSFSQSMCLDWESVAREAEASGVRTVLLRTGMVLDTEGGPLAQMLPAFEFGLGGPFGAGRHWMSWISRDDLVRLIDHAIRTESISGPLNGASPEPVPNRRFARALGEALHRPAFIPIPAFLLKAALGGLAREILLGSQQVIPSRALATGFRFTNPALQPFLNRIVGRSRAPAASSTVRRWKTQPH